MDKDKLSRKLAAVLHADVVGSTSLVQQDESLAHKRIHSVFQRFSEVVEDFGGVAQEVRGDALVAHFDRASNAVSASLEFQQANKKFNLEIKDQIRPELRIGISLGEVVVADNTITGEGVVLAQRLEQLAQPGGVVVQGSVSETVPARMPFEYTSLGKQNLKGINNPVQAYSVSLQVVEPLGVPQRSVTPKFTGLIDLQIPDQPSIAVLPFTNMSADPEQDYFADGMTDDIITALSKVPSMMVIARNSTSIYKGKAVDVRKVGREQGVRYVLEGGVRKVGQRVRISAQLIDASTGNHLWAERYDRDLEDIFTVQDEITRKIVSELDVHLRLGEEARLISGGTENLEAWECVRTGTDMIDGYGAVDVPEALRLAQKAIEIDPDYAQAWSLLSSCHWHTQGHPGVSADERERLLKSAHEYTQKALKIDPSYARAMAALALYDLHLRKHEDALENVKKAVKLAPNNARVIAISAAIMVKCGKPQIAFEQIKKAMRLSPVYPWWYLMILGQTSRLLGMSDVAIDAFREIVRLDSNSIEGLVGLAQILGESDKIEEAKKTAAEVLRINPEFSISGWVGNLAYRDPSEILRYSEGLRNAGLPE